MRSLKRAVNKNMKIVLSDKTRVEYAIETSRVSDVK